MNKKLKLVAVGIGVSCLSGCASLELMAVGGMSYLLTGKGLSDHALSMTLGEDCAFHRIVTEGSLCSEEQQESVEILMAQTSATDELELVATDTDLEQSNELSLVALPDAETSNVDVRNSLVIADSGIASVDRLVNIDLPSEQNIAPQVYAVVGSFNDLKYAFERSTLYRIYNTQIIETPKGSETRFRVVVGPLSDRGLVRHIPNKFDGNSQPHWAIELCEDSLMPPPCDGSLLAKN